MRMSVDVSSPVTIARVLIDHTLHVHNTTKLFSGFQTENAGHRGNFSTVLKNANVFPVI